jgi:hypothetical protein
MFTVNKAEPLETVVVVDPESLENLLKLFRRPFCNLRIGAMGQFLELRHELLGSGSENCTISYAGRLVFH